MFSGIIEEFATVVAIRHDQENIDFTLTCSFVDELGIDQSVAHNGVCLTVVKIEDNTYTVTAMKETLERSNLGLHGCASLFPTPSCQSSSVAVSGQLWVSLSASS